MSEQASPPAADPTPSLGSLGNPDPSAPPANTPIAPTTAQSFTDLLDDKGGFKQDWTKSLPEHLKPFEGTLGKYPTPFDALGALGHAQKHISTRDNVKLPGADATPEQWDAYRGAVSKITGAPAKPEDYGIKAPEGKELAPIAGEFAQLAHKYGAAPEFVHRAVDLYNKAMGDLVAQAESADKTHHDSIVTGLNNEWGKDAPENWQQAKRGIAILGGDPTKDKYDAGDVMRLALAADKMFREDKGLIHGDRGSTMTTIDEKMAQLKADPAYQNPKNDTELKRQAEIQQQLFALHEAKKKVA